MTRAPIPHRHKVLFALTGGIVLVLLGAIGAAVVLLSGAYSTAATKQHFGLTYRILDLGLRFSVEAAAGGLQQPQTDSANDVRIGHACYRQYCVQCHGAPGIARDALGRGELPSPSSLSQSAREWPATHLFYVTQKGVRMSGMPAWEFRISEDAIWSTVAFLKRMSAMTKREYAAFDAANDSAECPPPLESEPYSRERAQTILRQYACHNCHQLPGVVGPETYIGPSLEHWRSRKIIAGVLPNTADNVVRWIRNPAAISPDTLMPDMDVTEAHARVMARYLFDGAQ